MNDTVELLKECNSGSKMAITSINEVLEHIKDSQLKGLLQESKSHHEKLCDEVHGQLAKHGSEEKEPSAMAKGMSWMKTNMKLGVDESDSTVADLITDGCNMGVKSLHKYLNQYQGADDTAKDLCRRLVNIEESLCRDLQAYL